MKRLSVAGTECSASSEKLPQWRSRSPVDLVRILKKESEESIARNSSQSSERSLRERNRSLSPTDVTCGKTSKPTRSLSWSSCCNADGSLQQRHLPESPVFDAPFLQIPPKQNPVYSQQESPTGKRKISRRLLSHMLRWSPKGQREATLSESPKTGPTLPQLERYQSSTMFQDREQLADLTELECGAQCSASFGPFCELSPPTPPVSKVMVSPSTVKSRPLGEAFAVWNSQRLGLDQHTGIFGFDQLLNLFVFVTSESDLSLMTPDFELTLSNSVSGLTVSVLTLIPGAGRCLTFGTRSVRHGEKPRWPSTEGNAHTTNVLQVWDFARYFSSNSKRPEQFFPVTYELPYRITCMYRILHNRTVDPDTLFRRTIHHGKRLSKSPSASPSHRQDKHKVFSKMTPHQRLVVTSHFFSHPDNSPFPSGSPPEDSRWLVLFGTSEGDVRVFDGWSCSFTDYTITSENINQQLLKMQLLTDTHLQFFSQGRHKRLSTVQALAPHPSVPSSLLIGYSSGLIILWDFSTHKVKCCYTPFSSNYLQYPDRQSADQESTPTACVPDSMCDYVLVEALHSIRWHIRGSAFCVSFSMNCPANPAHAGDRRTAPGSMALCVVVFDVFRSTPIAIVSVDHILTQPLVEYCIPFMYWDQTRSSKTRLTAQSLIEAPIYIMLQHTTQTTHPFNASTFKASLANIYRLEGHQWSEARPIFPCGIGRLGSPFSFACAAVVQPSLYQSSTEPCPVSGALGGIRFPHSMEKDQGEDADTIVEAAEKLTRYLRAGTYFIVLADRPTRKIIMCCLKVDRERYKILEYLTTCRPVLSGQPTTSQIEDENFSDDYDDDDANFAPWDKMTAPVTCQVDWQSSPLSGVTSTFWIPRLMGGNSASPRGTELARFDDTGRRLATPNMTALDGFVDALFTLRRKQSVHAWIQGLLGKQCKIYVPSIPREQTQPSPTLQRDTSDSGSGSDEDDYNEWRRISEVLFFGDLLRVSGSAWGLGKEMASLEPPYRGILASGHLDGKVRIWATTMGALPSKIEMFPFETFASRPAENMFATVENPDLVDLEVIGEVNAKPVVPHQPDKNLLDASISKHLETTRYLVAGCLSGEIMVFQWCSTARPLSAIESRVLLTNKANAKALGTTFPSETLNELRENERHTAGWSSLLPYGFSCIARHKHHQCRVTHLHVLGVDSPAVLQKREKPRRLLSNIPFTKNLGFLTESSPTTSPTASAEGITYNLTPQSTSGLCLISADASGMICLYELPSGRALASLAPLSQSKSLDPLSVSIAAIAPISYPLITSTAKGMTFVGQNVPEVSRYAAVVYSSGITRMLDCASAKFLDSFGTESERFISQPLIPIQPMDKHWSPGTSTADNTVLLFEELTLVSSDRIAARQTADGEATLTGNVTWFMDGEKQRPKQIAALRHIVIATTGWLHVIQYRLCADATTGTAMTPRHAISVATAIETQAATYSFVDGISTVVREARLVVNMLPDSSQPHQIVLHRNGNPIVHAIGLTDEMELKLYRILSIERSPIRFGYPGLLFASDGSLVTTAQHQEQMTAWLTVATVSRMLRWETAARSCLNTACLDYARAADLVEKQREVPRQRHPDKQSKSWRSAVLGKLQYFTGGTALLEKGSPPTNTLRGYIKTAPRDCLVSVQEQKLRERGAPYVLVSFDEKLSFKQVPSSMDATADTSGEIY